MNLKYLYLFLVFLVSFCLLTSTKPIVARSYSPYSKLDIQVFSFGNSENGYGYDIYIGGVQIVHQPTIPVVSGNRKFQSKEKALKVGEFIARKIRRNTCSSLITMEELAGLGVI